MHSHNSIPLLLCHRRERLVSQNTSVGYENVNAAKLRQRSLDDGITVLCRANDGNSFASS